MFVYNFDSGVKFFGKYFSWELFFFADREKIAKITTRKNLVPRDFLYPSCKMVTWLILCKVDIHDWPFKSAPILDIIHGC